MYLDHLQENIVFSSFSSFFVHVELKGPNPIGMEMAFTEGMKYHSFLRNLALSSKHTNVLEKDITTLTTTLLMLQKHQNNSFSNMQTLRVFIDCGY
jgi:hypothetical protein